MSKINLDKIVIDTKPCQFKDDIMIEVTFSVSKPLKYPISWKVIYVGSARSEEFDQVLEEFDIDPVENCGILKFDIACQAPVIEKIPRNELLCVSALLLTASYRSQEFARVGYYVNNYIPEENDEEDIENILLSILEEKIKRTIVSEKPRITTFEIDWSDELKEVENEENKESNKKEEFCEKEEMDKLSNALEKKGKDFGEENECEEKKEDLVQ